MTNTKNPAFKKLSDFFAKKNHRVYKKGQIILYAGDRPSGVFYIEKGHVKAYSLSEKGEEKIHMFFKEHEIFPLVWPFKKDREDIFYQAVETVEVRISEEESFHTLIHAEPEVMHAIVHELIDVVDVFINRVENLQFAGSYNRLIARLLFLAERFGKCSGSKVEINLPTTHLDIANTISLTRETVSRDMEILLKKRLISQKSHFVTINNILRLKKELSV